MRRSEDAVTRGHRDAETFQIWNAKCACLRQGFEQARIAECEKTKKESTMLLFKCGQYLFWSNGKIFDPHPHGIIDGIGDGGCCGN